MIINDNVLTELERYTSDKLVSEAKNLGSSNELAITRVKYDDKQIKIYGSANMEDVSYEPYIEISDGELNDVKCTCNYYKDSYGTCKHILALAYKFNQSKEFGMLFDDNKKDKKIIEDDKEKYRIYRQMISEFYSEEQSEQQVKLAGTGELRVEPRVIFDKFEKNLKVEFKIGNKQMYKIKSIPQFYDRMQNGEKYKYGQKLDFIHSINAFDEESKPLINFVLKYAEILKYANENNSAYYPSVLNDEHILLTKSALDEFFEVMKNNSSLYLDEYGEDRLEFIDREPAIKFEVKELNDEAYALTTNIDVYDYTVLKGKEYLYFLKNNKIFRCSNRFEKTTLKLLSAFRVNLISEIPFKKRELADLYSLIVPEMETKIILDSIPRYELDEYLPSDLKVNIFLDYTKSDFVTANVNFKYESIEFNPFDQDPFDVSRNVIAESKALDLLKDCGFMLDMNKKELVLTDEAKIYDFIKVGVEQLIEKYEVLATESFKSRQIISPKMSSIGVKIENNLLSIDLSELNFDKAELEEVMQGYILKQKYHKLKNGQFVDLENNATLDALKKLYEGTNVDFKQLTSGKVQVPIYRSLYLDKILKQSEITVKQSQEYKELIDDVYNRQISDKYVLPNGLKALFREYQKVGFDWLKTLDDYKLGGILADDMGLGKTVQVLAVIDSYIEECEKNNSIEGGNQIALDTSLKTSDTTAENEKRPSLVICPSSLCLNWQEEAARFTPDIKTVVISGDTTVREKIIESIPEYDIVITSYDLLKRDLDIYKKYNYKFRYLIADEAQYIKNNTTKNARAIKEITADTRYALTGTPIENSLAELWSIFDFIMPGYLFTYNKFKIQFESPIIREDSPEVMNRLKQMIEPFVLRRVKEKVLTELPEKTISVLTNEMEGEQQKLYMAYMRSAKQQVSEEIETNGIQNSQIKILALLMRLRQICCHPGLFLENYTEGSKKLNQCMEIIEDAAAGGHKMLLFSGYSSMFRYIEEGLKEKGIQYLKLTGQTKVSERMKLVNEFNKNKNIKVFLISLKAGGTGLNLIGADMVIHYDPWWNLSAENQATDRTYRIGQKRNVQVYKLITKNSIEEKIYKLQEKKAKLADDMLSTNETFISKLSKDEIMELFE